MESQQSYITPIEEAKRLIESEKQERSKKCGEAISKAIESLCQEHNCQFGIKNEINNNTIISNILVIAL